MIEPSRTRFTVGGPAALYVLWICSSLWMMSFMDRQVAAVVLEPMRRDLGFGDAEASWLNGGFYLGLAVFAIPVAHLADRTSRRRAIAVMAVVWSLATLATGLCSDPYRLALARAGVGAGEAGFSAAGVSLISASSRPEQRAGRLGIFNLFQVVGLGLGALLAGGLSVKFGWRVPFYVFAVPGILLGFLALTMQDYPTVPSPKGAGLVTGIRELLQVRTLRWFYAGLTAFLAMTYSVLGWSPALMMRAFHIDEALSGKLTGLAGIWGLPGALVGGLIADRWQRRHPAGRMRFAAVATVAATLGVVIAIPVALWSSVESTGMKWLGGAIFNLGFCMCAAAVTPAVMAATQSVVTPDRKSLVWGLGLALVLAAGGGWMPTVVGYVSDALGGGAYGLSLALFGTGGFGIIAALCFAKAAQAYPADHDRVTQASVV
jgi:MFS family permease